MLMNYFLLLFLMFMLNVNISIFPVGFKYLKFVASNIGVNKN